MYYTSLDPTNIYTTKGVIHKPFGQPWGEGVCDKNISSKTVEEGGGGQKLLK